MQGRSLVPLLKGQDPADWRTSFYYHYYEYPGPHNVHRHYGVVTDRYKLVHFYEPEMNEWELFDLETDPRELQQRLRPARSRQVQAGASRGARAAAQGASGALPGPATEISRR